MLPFRLSRGSNLRGRWRRQALDVNRWERCRRFINASEVSQRKERRREGDLAPRLGDGWTDGRGLIWGKVGRTCLLLSVTKAEAWSVALRGGTHT